MDRPALDLDLRTRLEIYWTKLTEYSNSLPPEAEDARKQCDHELTLLHQLRGNPVSQRVLKEYEPLGKRLKELTAQKEAIASELKGMRTKTMEGLRRYNELATQSIAVATEANLLRINALVSQQEDARRRLGKEGLSQIEKADIASLINRCNTELEFIGKENYELSLEGERWKNAASGKFLELFGGPRGSGTTRN